MSQVAFASHQKFLDTHIYINIYIKKTFSDVVLCTQSFFKRQSFLKFDIFTMKGITCFNTTEFSVSFHFKTGMNCFNLNTAVSLGRQETSIFNTVMRSQ